MTWDIALAAQAGNSSSFRAAAKHAGKQVFFYDKEKTAQTPEAAMAGVVDAVVSFATQYFSASTAGAH